MHDILSISSRTCKEVIKMQTFEAKIKHYNLLLKKLDKKIEKHIRKSPVMQSGGISNRYLYLTKRYVILLKGLGG